MRALLDLCRDKAILVIDEAHIEFAEHESYASVLSENKNLVILRTLSKAYGLADYDAARLSLMILFWTILHASSLPIRFRAGVETALAALTTTASKRCRTCKRR